VMFAPIIFVCFTLFMLIKMTPFVLFTNSILMVSYGYFFYEDLRDALGFEPFSRDLPLFSSDVMGYAD
jgi:predicted membrane protein